MTNKLGIIHGRFQILHNGHLEYLLEGLNRCEYLLIGISSPDSSYTKFTAANPHRSLDSANPMTYYERFQMIRAALLEQSVPRERFDIVPFPINVPEKLFNYVPKDGTYLMTLYDEWSHEKYATLSALGCEIEVMWERTNEQKITSGTEVRSKIILGEPWEKLVSDSVSTFIKKNEIDQRIIRMSEEG